MGTADVPAVVGTVTLWESDNGRLLVRIAGRHDWDKAWISRDFWRLFRRHSEAHWRERDTCWSLPLQMRVRLELWLESLPEGVEIRRR